MAELKIEKKRALWPWLLLALLFIAGIIYLYYSLTTIRDAGGVENAEANTETSGRNNNSGAVGEFISYVNSDTTKMRRDHSYTKGAFLRLTQAISAKANEIGYDVKADLDKVKEYADLITNEPFETSHAGNIRKAADILSTSLQNLQQAKYPVLANTARQLKEAAMAIKPDVLTLDQEDAVKTFFGRAADLLQQMS